MPNVMTGTDGNDTITGTGASDEIYGLGGNDTLTGNEGDDLISGGGKVSSFDPNQLVLKEAWSGDIDIETPAKGAVNPVGMYKIDAAGNITGVQILFNGGVSGPKGTGSAPTHTKVHIDLAAGERYAFFILGNGYGTNGNNKLLADATAKWELRDEAGGTGDLADKGLRLWHVNPKTGAKTMISKAAGHEIYHSIDGGGFSPNPDGVTHVKTEVDFATGSVTLGLEAQKTNNPDFADAIIRFNIGTTNTLNLPPSNPKKTGNADTINGGEGQDKLFGMGGDDTVSGGNGNDQIWGNSGNDVLNGGDGDDVMTGGKDHDTLFGDAGNDKLKGDTGNDRLSGGDGDDALDGGKGNDVLSDGAGNDVSLGGSGDDYLIAGEGDDSYIGGSGTDTIDFSAFKGVKVSLQDNTAAGAGNDKLDGIENATGSMGDDALTGDKGANALSGGEGNDLIKGGRGSDVLTGGDGADTFTWGSGKDVKGELGTDRFTDHITDFSKGDVLDFRFLPDLKPGKSAESLVHIRVDGGNTILSAALSTGGPVHDIVVLDGVTGISVAQLYADGALLL